MSRAIPIIRYTHVRDLSDSASVSVSIFERHIAYLQKNKYTFLNLDDILALKVNAIELPQKCVLLTFDAGWRDIYEFAYPILKQYVAKAGLFLVTEWIDEASKINSEYISTPHNECKNTLLHNARSVMSNWEEIQKMADVFSFGSMTHTYQFSNVISLSWHEDFELSKKMILQHLNIDTKHLAWPDGIFNAGLLRTAKSIGYEAFYTMDENLNLLDSNNDTLNRFKAKNSAFWIKKMLFATRSLRNFRIGKLLL